MLQKALSKNEGEEVPCVRGMKIIILVFSFHFIFDCIIVKTTSFEHSVDRPVYMVLA